MTLVLDSSVALAFVFSDETTDSIRAIFDQINNQGAWVPALWRIEVANVLEMSIRRGRIDAVFRDATLADLASFPIQLDAETDRHAWGATTQLATRHRLTMYDAIYLELAQRRRLPLATLDLQLQHAAIAEGVPILS